MLFIDNETVRQILNISDTIESLDTAFRGLVDGGSIHRPRIDVYVPTGREEDYYRWGTMEGASRDLGVFAIRMKSDVISWPVDAEGNWTEEKYCVEPGTYCGLIFLFSTVNGEPLAIIKAGYLPHMRVGGGAGLDNAPLARIPLKPGDGDTDTISEPAEADGDDKPLTIVEAKRRLALSLGVDPSNVKITVEA